MSILEKINSPSDLKKLSRAELETLAQEIRQQLISSVSQTGGHIASNLGVVELTIALHAVLNAPHDKIIWDTGHQAYVHKLLTGRRELFSTLRQFGGISGFPRREESIFDAVSVGHAGTAISTALGLAKGRDLLKQNHTVVAVVGDAAVSSGLSFEAINNTAHFNTPIIIILNDNEMSISKTVGALSNYVNRIRTSLAYRQLKENVEKVISRIPRIGAPLTKRVEHLVDRFKHFFIDLKMGVIFEELGFKYVGPLDGHNIALLMSAIRYAKEVKTPIIIHAITKKGKGFSPAETDPTGFHGISPVKKEKIPSISEKPTSASYTECFGKTLINLAKDDKKIVAITAAMPDGTGLVDFAQKFPDRFFDVGIAEEHAVTFAAGLASSGLRPIVAIYSTFLQRAYDQIIHDVCLDKLPVVFCIDRGGIVGDDGPTHHGLFDLAYLRSIPNMVVSAPKDENELNDLLATAMGYNGPFAIRYPRGKGIGKDIGEKFKKKSIGVWEIVFNAGNDISILACGSMVYPSIQAAEKLSKQNINVRVVNCCFIKPLDETLLREILSTSSLVLTIEEGIIKGGFGSAVCEFFALLNFGKSSRIINMGIPDEFVEHGSMEILRKKYKLDTEGIIITIKNHVK